MKIYEMTAGDVTFRKQYLSFSVLKTSLILQPIDPFRFETLCNQ